MNAVASLPPAARSVVASLTEEEIDVLCDGDHHVVVLPHLSLLDHQEARIARRTAERSLVARGLLLAQPESAPSDVSAQDESVQTVAVHDLLAPVLQMRRGAPIVVVLHRIPTADLMTLDVPASTPARPGAHLSSEIPASTAPGTRSSLTRYLFVHEGTCVCEDVTGQGVHTLSVCRTERVAAVLAEFLVPPRSCAPRSAETILADPADLPSALRALGHPVVLAEVTILHPWIPRGQAPARLLSLGPGGCFVADLEGSRKWRCRPTPPGDLVAGLVEEISAAAERVTREQSEHNGGCD